MFSVKAVRRNLFRGGGFFDARLPLKISYIGANDAFRKFLRLVSRKWMS